MSIADKITNLELGFILLMFIMFSVAGWGCGYYQARIKYSTKDGDTQ